MKSYDPEEWFPVVNEDGKETGKALRSVCDNALVRETREELGLINFIPRFLVKYVWQSSREKELINAYSSISEEIPEINKDEIEEGRYWTLMEIKENLGNDIFTPSFEHEFRMLFLK